MQSQSPEFKNYTTKDGLITDDVYDLYQDKQGYIWVFSPYGTVKYNGTEFKQVLKNLPQKESFIYAIYENKKGHKWVANSNAKIYEIRNDSAFMILGFEAISDSLKREVSEITKLLVDDSLNMYVMTKGHSYKFRLKKGNYKPMLLCERMGPGGDFIKTFRVGGELLQAVNHFRIDDLNRIWKKKHLYFQLAGKKHGIQIELPGIFLKKNVRAVKEFYGNYYFSWSGYLYRVNDEGTVLRKKIGNSLILTYTQDNNRHTWIGCLNDGLYELDEKENMVSHYFPGTTINDILIDHKNELWLSTPGTGLFQSRDINYTTYDKTKLSHTSISLIKKIDNELFIATAKGDFFFVKKNKLHVIREANENMPSDIVKDKNGYFVAGVFALERFHLSKSHYSNVFPRETSFRQILQKNADTLIYIWRKGISFSVHDRIKKRLDFGRKVFSGVLYKGLLWLGTEDGVYQYRPFFSSVTKDTDPTLISFDTDSLMQPRYLKGTQGSSVVKIVEDPFHTLWFCTKGNGLFHLSGNRLFNYTEETGLPSNFVNAISFTEDHATLLSTNKGLFISGFNMVTDEFKEWSALYEGEVLNAVLFEDKIYMSAKSGLVTIAYASLKKNTGRSFFNLAGISVDSVTVSRMVFKGLKSGLHSVEFKFDCIAAANTSPLIRYTLSGPSGDAGFIKNDAIRFNDLLPGDYTVSAFPFFKNGKKLEITIPFVVEPAFWQKPSVQLLFFVLIAALIFVIVWLVIRYNKKKQDAITKNEQLILEYKLIALKAQINPHFISNCLSAIQELVVSDQTDKATFYIAEFGLLVRQILDFSSKQLITLQEELGLLKIYVELEQLRFENAFSFVAEIESDISPKEIYIPPLILNPIVENAIWHGLLPVRNFKPVKLLVTVKRKDTSLVISVEDNGAGRQTNKNSIGNTKSASYGIKITEQRLSNINYLYGRNSARMEYEDLHDANDEGTGTRVTIYLPQINSLKHEQN